MIKICNYNFKDIYNDIEQIYKISKEDFEITDTYQNKGIPSEEVREYAKVFQQKKFIINKEKKIVYGILDVKTNTLYLESFY